MRQVRVGTFLPGEEQGTDSVPPPLAPRGKLAMSHHLQGYGRGRGPVDGLVTGELLGSSNKLLRTEGDESLSNHIRSTQ